MPTLSIAHREELTQAKSLLECPPLLIKLSDIIGRPIEGGLKRLPDGIQKSIGNVTQDALMRSLKFAVNTLGTEEKGSPSTLFHKALVGASGALGGSMGLATLAIELPITTTLMFRSIAEIARAHGESLGSHESRLSCLEVFALGGRSSSDDSAESAYFATRIALAYQLREAATYLTTTAAKDVSAPVLIRFISSIANRFGITVTEKAIAQAVPIIGAASGATINIIFMSHFQNIAKGHFTVRRLERIYGEDTVKNAY